MTRPTPLPWWHAALMYTAFDVRNLLGQRRKVLGILVLPLLPVGVLLLMTPTAWVGASLQSERHVVVVSPDATLRPRLEQQLGREDVVIEVVPVAPPDLDARLAAGAVELAIELPPDFRDSGASTVREGEGTLGAADRARTQLQAVWLRERVATMAGSDPAIAVVDRDGKPLPEERPAQASLTAEGVEEATREAQRMLGLFVIGVFGTMLGFAVGPALAKSMKVGFNHLLSLGTPPFAIYVGEMTQVGVLQIAQSVVWWWVLCVAALVAGRALPVELPPLGDVLAAAPVFVGLALVAGVQSVALSLVAARAAEDLPQDVREKGLGFVLVPLLFLGGRWLDLDDPGVLTTLSALPITGPLTLWMAHVRHAPGQLPLLLAQVGWAAGALLLGAWAFGLDESPQAHLKRAWRRRRAA